MNTLGLGFPLIPGMIPVRPPFVDAEMLTEKERAILRAELWDTHTHDPQFLAYFRQQMAQGTIQGNCAFNEDRGCGCFYGHRTHWCNDDFSSLITIARQRYSNFHSELDWSLLERLLWSVRAGETPATSSPLALLDLEIATLLKEADDEPATAP